MIVGKAWLNSYHGLYQTVHLLPQATSLRVAFSPPRGNDAKRRRVGRTGDPQPNEPKGHFLAEVLVVAVLAGKLLGGEAAGLHRLNASLTQLWLQLSPNVLTKDV